MTEPFPTSLLGVVEGNVFSQYLIEYPMKGRRKKGS